MILYRINTALHLPPLLPASEIRGLPAQPFSLWPLAVGRSVHLISVVSHIRLAFLHRAEAAEATRSLAIRLSDPFLGQSMHSRRLEIRNMSCRLVELEVQRRPERRITQPRNHFYSHCVLLSLTVGRRLVRFLSDGRGRYLVIDPLLPEES